MTDSLKCYVLPTEIPWFVSLKCRYEVELDKWLHDQPGCKFDKKRSFWWVPIEIASLAMERAKQCGLDVDCHWWPVPSVIPSVYLSPAWDRLRKYQREQAVRAALTDGTGRWIEGSEMGTGKSPIVLTAAQLRNVKRGIIVDTAAHRLDWFNPKRPEAGEFGKWWPDHPAIETIETGERAKASTAPIRVVSYQLLHKLDMEQPIDFIWFDEAHYLQNPETQWSKAARKLVNEVQPKAWVVAMTGTLIPDDTMTVFNILDILWPNRWGWTKWDFAKAYAHGETNDFGKMEFAGTNEERAPEFRKRLQFMSARKTKPEILAEDPKALPAFNPKVSWFKVGKRLEHAHALANDLLMTYPKVTVLTHLHETAQAMVELFERDGIPVVRLVGDGQALPPRQRHELIRKAKDMERCVIVSTLHSVKEGISLTFAPKAIYVESYQRPVEVLQSLNRFNRMDGSTEPADLFLLAQEGGDPVVEALCNKIEAASMVWKAGASEEGMLAIADQLRGMGLTQEEVNALLQGAATDYDPSLMGMD